MTTYIALFNLTDAGIKAAKDSPRRLDAARSCWPGIVTLPWGQARSVGGSGIFRLLRRRSAMCPSPQREARGAFGLK
jgi:hypothetical protein